jgi:multidrug efflux pump subunit AcrA (membrane-fusion protein)
MFGQAVSAARTPALAAAAEIKLPLHAKRQESLFVLAPAYAGPQAPTLKTYGLVVPDSQALVDINVSVSGQVKDVYVRVGDRVRKGQPIVSIFNPEFVTTQRGYLEFLKNEDRLQVLREEGRLPDYLKDAKENLRWWGMNDKEIADLIARGKVVEHIVLDAPADGFVTDLLVQPGSLVNAGDRTMKQFVVVGRAVARMVAAGIPYWVEGYVFPDQGAQLRPGMPARISLPDGRTLSRPIVQVLPLVDAATQRARFLVDLGRTPTGLAVGQMVDMSLQLGSRTGTWVSRQAVVGQAISPAVYVRIAPGRYLRKPVVVLDETADALRVEGVDAGDRLVVAGKMILEGLYRISAGPGAAGAPHHDHH